MAASHTFVFVRSADEDSGGISAQRSSTSSPGRAACSGEAAARVSSTRLHSQLTQRLLSTHGRADMSRRPQRWREGSAVWRLCSVWTSASPNGRAGRVAAFPLGIRGALIPGRCQVRCTLEMIQITSVIFSMLHAVRL